ncbi:hypothetical protein CH251_13865 [Rhodococcus sp. 06-462-5]|uniref:acyl-CoA thioesterase n=1 Tax=unclassified Rhodococcus (in: high G+C Gram-positive bacteria) TaxID=192944 RepID=UPI000B9B6A5D|nr:MULTISPECIES: acyl-CoA thioesterase [unclassified Rhodococcus (in: high G+C Gram-positive bacteria)]OZC73621.1 hypothetical protein CH251_13865 [Rhodococcus sp. 06-462-5]OZE63430.1 hypothetical protein CH270_18240 [Rhodococcus sp. 02-925g]
MSPIVFRAQVRYGDFDPQRHVSNVQYFRFFEEARAVLYRRAGLPADLGQVIRRQEIDYFAPIGFDIHEIDVVMTALRSGRSSYDLGFVLRSGTHEFARATVSMVAVGPDGRPTPIPARLGLELAAASP